MRYAVDPTQLHAAAAHVETAAALARRARESLSRSGTDGWCPGPVLQGAVGRALNDLELAAIGVQEHGLLVAAMLVAAADGYEDADSPRPR
jgi:hypothetical protein